MKRIQTDVVVRVNKETMTEVEMCDKAVECHILEPVIPEDDCDTESDVSFMKCDDANDPDYLPHDESDTDDSDVDEEDFSDDRRYNKHADNVIMSVLFVDKRVIRSGSQIF